VLNLCFRKLTAWKGAAMNLDFLINQNGFEWTGMNIVQTYDVNSDLEGVFVYFWWIQVTMCMFGGLMG
jgi:hypothetical protein